MNSEHPQAEPFATAHGQALRILGIERESSYCGGCFRCDAENYKGNSKQTGENKAESECGTSWTRTHLKCNQGEQSTTGNNCGENNVTRNGA